MRSTQEFVTAIPNFYSNSGMDHILLIAWHIHTDKQKTFFDSAMLRDCFRQASLDSPNIGQYLTRLSEKKPPQIKKERAGYRLSAAIKREMDAKYGDAPTTVTVSKLLSDLPNKIPNLAEKVFLSEALKCYKIGAYRASIVMVWNLAYDHICNWILSDTSRLSKFNSNISIRFPKKTGTISIIDDFSELKESEVIEICRTASLLSKNATSILKDKLTRRNLAAHPSSIVLNQHQADDAISDLITNIVLVIN
jgi:hypothetical protein